MESATPTNLAKAIRIPRRSAALALPAASVLRRAHSGSAMRILSGQLSHLALVWNAMFPPAIARKLDSLPPMAPG